MRTEVVTCERCNHVFKDGEEVYYQRYERWDDVPESDPGSSVIELSELCETCAGVTSKIFDSLDKRGRNKKNSGKTETAEG